MSKMQTTLPICIVDDDVYSNSINEHLATTLRAAGPESEWASRRIVAYDSLAGSLELLEWDEPFVLLLDHNMKAGVDEDVARRMGEDPATQLFGYHLSKAIRQQCKFGLIIPIVYLSAAMQSPAEFTSLLMADGPFLPDFWQNKNDYLSREKGWIDLITVMDRHYVEKLAQVQDVAARVVWDSLDLVGDGEPEESEGDAHA